MVLLRAAIVALDGVIADVPTGGKEQRWEGGVRINCEGKIVLRSVLAAECFRFEWCGGRTSRSRGIAIVFYLQLALHCDALGSRWYHGAIVNLPDTAGRPIVCLFPPSLHLCMCSTHLAHHDGNSSGNSNSRSSDGRTSIESSLYTAAEVSPPSPPPSKTARKGLTRTLTATLAFLGTSLLALDRQPDTSTNGTSASEGTASALGDGGSGGSASPGPEGERGTMADGSGGDQGPAVVAESPAAAAAAAVVAPAPASVSELYEEAVHVLKRALGMLRIEAAALSAAASVVDSSPQGATMAAGAEKTAVAAHDGGVDRRKEDVTAETARVLDALSEAHARARRWEQARCSAVRVGQKSRKYRLIAGGVLHCNASCGALINRDWGDGVPA